jgi:copper(I)-binding protein
MLPMRLVVAAACAAFLACPALADAGVSVSDPWVRALGAGPGAAYLTIENRAEQPDRLLGATAEPGAAAELHESRTDAAGASTMAPVEGGLALAPGETVVLQPGGLHVMIMDLPRLEPGATVRLTLTFERAGEVVVDAPLDNRRRPAAAGHDGHAGHGAPASE